MRSVIVSQLIILKIRLAAFDDGPLPLTLFDLCFDPVRRLDVFMSEGLSLCRTRRRQEEVQTLIESFASILKFRHLAVELP